MNAQRTVAVVTQRKCYIRLMIFSLLIIHSVTANSNRCFHRMYRSIGMITYRTVSRTEDYGCGLFGWRRCRRVIYMQASMISYSSTSQPACCAGHALNQEQDACLPICQDCMLPRICVAPNTCKCHEGYSGISCNDPVCQNCSPRQRCVAPSQCECHTGFNGTDCTSDVDECQTSNGGCDHFCNNTDGSYICSCQQQFILSHDQLSCIGTLNITWNILNNGTLSLEWERPIWDTRNITRGVKINCSDSNYQILEYRDISDSMIVLAGLNLSATTTCCHTLMTLNETGPQKCDEYNNRSVAHDEATLPVENSPTTVTDQHHASSEHAIASSNNTEAIIAGTSGVVLLLLLLAIIIVIVLIIYGVSKRRKCVRDDSASVSIQNEQVYNVIFHSGVDTHHRNRDNQNSVSEVEIQYDSLRFETNTGTETNMQDSIDGVSEYSHLRH